MNVVMCEIFKNLYWKEHVEDSLTENDPIFSFPFPIFTFPGFEWLTVYNPNKAG